MALKKEAAETLDLEIYTKTGKLRKRKPKKSRDYFTQETEDAIVRYNNSENEIERNRIFSTYINDSLFKLVENIMHTYKYYYRDFEDVEDLKHQVVVFLLEKFHRYDPSLGKAYSFFGTIAKRYLIVYNKANYKKLKQKAEIEEVDEDENIYNNIVREAEDQENSSFADSYVSYIEHNLETIFPDEKDQMIVVSILEVMKRRKALDVFNKQQFYFYIKELTGCQTPAITKVMKTCRALYKELMNVVYLERELDTDTVNIY